MTTWLQHGRAALPACRFGSNPPGMQVVFDMDDRARLPWRFHRRGFGAFLRG